MDVLFKLTIWESFRIPEEYENRKGELAKAIEEGKITCQEDLEDFLGDSFLTHEPLMDTIEYITPGFKQQGFSTVELLDDDKFIYISNGKDYNDKI